MSEPADPPADPSGLAEPADPSGLAASLALVSFSDFGPARLAALGRDHPRPTDALEALRAFAGLRPNALGPHPFAHLLSCRSVTEDHLRRWSRQARELDPEALLRAHRDAGIGISSSAQLAAHPLFAQDPEPPALLFRRGHPFEHSQRRVAVVGTRRCSAYGRQVAKRLGEELAHAGITLISGLASGIDGTAQAACLSAGGNVVGVVACGLDVVYPPSNAALTEQIANTGTLLSEWPLGTPATRWRFPARNRIIAALAELVIVVESPLTGGSLYTVDAAAERSIPVRAVPGPVTVRTSEGTNALIADGCEIVRGIEDVLLALDITPGDIATASGAASPASGAVSTASGAVSTASGAGQLSLEHSALLDLITATPCTADELLAELNRQSDPAQPAPTHPAPAEPWTLGRLALALDHLQSVGWLEESGGWWERVR